MQEQQDELPTLTKPLWKRSASETMPVPSGQTPYTDSIKLYAITINPCPTAKLNRKLYRNYDCDSQMKMLGRIEASLRRRNPSIELKEIHYEKCPSNGQIHFHALYSMPSAFQSTVVAHYRRILDSSDSKTQTPWRYIDLNVVRSRSAWLDYIRKDIQ